MKIKLKDLKSNPYRDLKKYPIRQERIESLKASIEQTGFWDNVLARPAGEQYELAYGHNRLEALRQLRIEEIDIPIKSISDADMVRIMATENREQYDENQSILIETVQTVKDFLNNELAKYDTIKEVPSHIMNLLDGTRQEDFARLKSKGVGQTTILKFLGAGWKQWKIQHALEVLNSPDINPEAIKEFESTGMGSAFTKAIKEINKETNKPVDFDEQMRLAKKLSETPKGNIAPGRTGGGNYYSSIKDIIKEEVSTKYLLPKKKQTIPSEKIKDFDSLIAVVRNDADLMSMSLAKLLQLKDVFDSDYYQKSLGSRQLIMTLNNIQLQINQLINTKNHETSELTNTGIKSLGR